VSGNLFVVVVLAAAVVAIVVLVVRSRGANDGVDSFRRQIDALSPEARRPVIDQVQNAAGRQPTEDSDGDSDAQGDHPDDEDGVRGA
jgi:hypothetical protein